MAEATSCQHVFAYVIVTRPGRTATAGVTVNVTHPVSAVSISAYPGTILAGESSTLTWTSTNADSCVIDHGVGSVALNGTTTVSPIETTTYTITATGLGGTVTNSVTVTVMPQISLMVVSNILCKFFLFNFFKERQIFLHFSNRV